MTAREEEYHKKLLGVLMLMAMASNINAMEFTKIASQIKELDTMLDEIHKEGMPTSHMG